ncbi:MAG: D-amino-acid transaminase [Alphaproteobacteria bacterium]|nr:D-amino-acid transaminase [Alphaproteobacteria bacterium]MDE2336880.1 D-amino-acid transaminase [Alphaproteobacteria bacterium]
MPRYSYVNGRYVPHAGAAVHIEDRGFQFADGVYEVISFVNGHFADEAGHLDRLERSLHEMRIAQPMPRKALQLVLRAFIRRNRLKNAYVYIQVTRGAAPRDFRFPAGDVRPTLVITHLLRARFDLEARKKLLGKAVTVPDIRWKRRDIKTTGLTAQVLAKQEAVERGAYEAWMVDDKGFVTEGSSTNAWIVDKKGMLVTRPTDHHDILKGVTRNAIQALCKKEGVKLVERAFTPAEAYKAKEAFITAAGTLVMPIVEIDGHKIGDGRLGTLTEKILDLYFAYASDKKRRQERWTPK